MQCRSLPKDLMLRYMGNRTNGYPCGCICLHYHPSVCVSVLHIHHRTILRFPSVQHRKKAFSTYSSHMIVVSITYGSCIFIYVKPLAKEEMAINKGVSVPTTAVAPLLNPFIYTLRSKQVKQAFNNSIKRITFLSKESKLSSIRVK